MYREGERKGRCTEREREIKQKGHNSERYDERGRDREITRKRDMIFIACPA